jgi:hypothetical protein
MTDDPFTGPDWDRFVKDATDNVLPKLSLSGAGLVLVPDNRTDVKSAVQLGFRACGTNPSWLSSSRPCRCRTSCVRSPTPS